MGFYLSMDGVDDTLVTYLTFTEIVIDMAPNNAGNDFGNYVNAGGSSFSKLYANDTWNGFNAVYKNSVLQTKGTPVVTNNVRAVYRIVSPTAITTNVFIFNASFNDLMKGNIYDIKFYNGASLVAWYDMSKGNVLDQSGNNKNATLNGGTWINEAPVYVDGSITLSLVNAIYKDTSSQLNLIQSLFKDAQTLLSLNNTIYKDNQTTFNLVQSIFADRSIGLDLKQVIYKDSINQLNLVQSIYKDIQTKIDLVQEMYKTGSIDLSLVLSVRDDIYMYKQVLETIFNIKINLVSEFAIKRELETTFTIKRKLETEFTI